MQILEQNIYLVISTDLAVGAPYEAGGSGAVYIYRGSATGLLTTASQKLVAKDVSPNLKGFGISISRGTDIDGNGYAGKLFFSVMISSKTIHH